MKCKNCGAKCSGNKCRECFTQEHTESIGLVETDRRGLEGLEALTEYRQIESEDRNAGGWVE